jgi:hypothetical protein
MAIDHRLLYRVERMIAAQAFHRDDVRRIELKHKLNAGVDRAISEFCPPRIAVNGWPADENGAGAAIALAADDLRTDQPASAAKIVGKGEKCVATANFLPTAVDVEDKVLAHGRFFAIDPGNAGRGRLPVKSMIAAAIVQARNLENLKPRL